MFSLEGDRTVNIEYLMAIRLREREREKMERSLYGIHVANEATIERCRGRKGRAMGSDKLHEAQDATCGLPHCQENPKKLMTLLAH
jgi:hypothetical protein